MKMKVFAAFDQKARAFGQPFFCPNEHVALRSFESAANDKQTDIGLYPTDFSLYELGVFDNATGMFELHTEPQHMALALTLVNAE